MRCLRRVQSESSMDRQPTLETHPKSCTQKQFKQHPQAQPHYSTPTTPAKLECCEKLVNQNKELQNILQEQEEQIESLQDTVSNLIDKNKSLMSNLCDRIEDSVPLRLKVASSNQELHNALESMRVMSYTVHELEDQISQLKQMHGSKTTPRTIIISKLLSKSYGDLEVSSGKDVRISSESVGSRVFTNLKDTLDAVLSPDETQHLIYTFEQWFGEERLNSVSLVTCYECQKVKFKRAISSKGTVCINEFTNYPGFTCIYSICSFCFFKSFSYSFELLRETWWKSQGTTIYIPCPCGRCGRDIPLQSRGPLTKLLDLMEDKCLGERNIRT
jgi:myosin heavy subunit